LGLKALAFASASEGFAAAAGVKTKDLKATPKRRHSGNSEMGDALCAGATEGMSAKYETRQTGRKDANAL